MPHVRLTKTAEQELLAIAQYVAFDNPTAAASLVDRFDQAFLVHARQPMAAALYQPRPTYRHFTVGRYVVFYQAEDDGILIARVLHGARDLPNLLD